MNYKTSSNPIYTTVFTHRNHVVEAKGVYDLPRQPVSVWQHMYQEIKFR